MTEEPLWKEEYNERAAILEYDAGFSRNEAEEEAKHVTRLQRTMWRKKHEQVQNQNG